MIVRSSVLASLLFSSWFTSLIVPLTRATELQKKCEETGFGNSPLCSDCNRLEEYVKDEGLAAECRACCVHGSAQDTKEKYKKAVLEICKFNIGATPHIEQFVEKKLEKYPSLEVRYLMGTRPRLHLVSGDKKETIRIDHWKTEEIEEYLKGRLESQEEA